MSEKVRMISIIIQVALDWTELVRKIRHDGHATIAIEMKTDKRPEMQRSQPRRMCDALGGDGSARANRIGSIGQDDKL